MFLLTSPMAATVLIYALAAFFPAVFLMRFIYKHDIYEKEPMNLLVKLIFGGLLAAGASILLEQLLLDGFLPTVPISSETMYFIATATIVALVEEGTKLFFLKRFTWRSPDFNYRYDGVVYAVFVSLGFAAIENLLYIFQYGLSVAWVRGVLAVPAHMAFAVYMGAFYGRAKICDVQGDHQGMVTNRVLSYLVPVAFHAFYDATAMVNTSTATMLFVGFVVIMYVIVYTRIKNESRRDTEIY
ncbi:MAG: PrsW family intramembrane metalloprotease [Solobacterium sp.]|nr:PrsW family intramembrane metalloprotease [Solobacterium sp.]